MKNCCSSSKRRGDYEGDTLQGTNISPKKWHFEDDFPFPKVGYVNSLEGNSSLCGLLMFFVDSGGDHFGGMIEIRYLSSFLSCLNPKISIWDV